MSIRKEAVVIIYFSAYSLANDLGKTSPKVKISTVITVVLIKRAEAVPPNMSVAIFVDIAAAAIFTKLFPTKIVESVWSKFSESLNALAAPGRLISTQCFNLILLILDSAVSDAEKYAENANSIIKMNSN